MLEENVFSNVLMDFQASFRFSYWERREEEEPRESGSCPNTPVAGVNLPIGRGKDGILMCSQVKNGHWESHLH